jgi:hypothetical protein
MASTAKLNIEKATVRQLFRVVSSVKATDEINEASFNHGQNKLSYNVDIMAQGSEFYMPNIFWDRITVAAKGYPDTGISTWSDLELVNTKSGWESLGIVSSSLLSGVKYGHMHNPYPIKQTMAGVDVENRHLRADATVWHVACTDERGLSGKDTEIRAYPAGLTALHPHRLEHIDPSMGGGYSRICRY